MTVNNTPPLTFLVVDDDNSNRLILKTILENLNYNVLTANNGKEAVDIFKSTSVDMILMDVIMPIMDGYDASRNIKSLSENKFVPIIFITSITDNQSLSRCLECGGDDFLIKPFNKVILQSKINALSRTMSLYNKIRAQQNKLTLLNEQLIREQKVAENIFSNVIIQDSPPDNVRYLLKPHSISSGDIFLFAETADNRQLFLLGDFTGHGLSAAIGALPTSDTFHALAAKSATSAEILHEINHRLTRILPTGFYCAAGLVDINYNNGCVQIWNGGIPDILIRKSGLDTLERYTSTNLPLGILESSTTGFEPVSTCLGNSDSIYIFSDGSIEAMNDQNEMFGSERISSIILNNNSSKSITGEVSKQIADFCGNAEQHDDITFAEVCFNRLTTAPEIPTSVGTNPAPAVTIIYDFDTELLRLPFAANSITDAIAKHIKLDSKSVNEINIVLTELYNNALDHGILSLDSAIKDSYDGFTQYYNIRKLKLSELESGHIRITIQLDDDHHNKFVNICVTDSGKGYNSQAVTRPLNPDRKCTHNHGIAIIKSLCDNLTICEDGNTSTARYSLGSH